MSNSYYRHTDSAAWLGWAFGFAGALLFIIVLFFIMPIFMPETPIGIAP